VIPAYDWEILLQTIYPLPISRTDLHLGLASAVLGTFACLSLWSRNSNCPGPEAASVKAFGNARGLDPDSVYVAQFWFSPELRGSRQVIDFFLPGSALTVATGDDFSCNVLICVSDTPRS